MILSIIHGGYCDPAVNTADIINENCSFFPLKDLAYLRLRQSQQNGRMCNDDKLRSLCCAPVDLHKQGHLAHMAEIRLFSPPTHGSAPPVNAIAFPNENENVSSRGVKSTRRIRSFCGLSAAISLYLIRKAGIG